jgi:hypothetical protein
MQFKKKIVLSYLNTNLGISFNEFKIVLHSIKSSKINVKSNEFDQIIKILINHVTLVLIWVKNPLIDTDKRGDQLMKSIRTNFLVTGYQPQDSHRVKLSMYTYNI